MSQDRLTPEDRVLLRSDRDPRSRVALGGIALLDGPGDADLLRRRLDAASRRHVVLRSKIVEPAVATTDARWTIDPDFDLDRHVRRVALPAPGGRAHVLALAEQLLSDPLDPTRPLWSVTLVDGVRAGSGQRVGSAVLTVANPLLRSHDGWLDLLEIALDDSGDQRELPPVPVPTDLEPLDLARAGLRELPVRAAGLALGAVSEAAALAMRGVVHPRSLVDATLSLTSPTPEAPGSPLLTGRGATRALLTLSAPMSRVRSASGRHDAESVHLAGIRAGLMRYHDALGLPQSTLTMTQASHPTQFRRALAPAKDPVDSFGRLLPLLPAGLLDAVVTPTRGADVAVSHLRGSLSGALGSAKVTELYAVGPVPGNALTSVAVATEDTLFVAVRHDVAAIREPELLATALAEGFEDVLGPAPTPTAKKAPAVERAPAVEKAPAAKRAPAVKKAAAKTTAAKTTATKTTAAKTVAPRTTTTRKKAGS